MITQIYSIISAEEALACIEAGADHIGLAAGYKDQLPCGLTLEEGKAVFDAVGTRAKKVALTIKDTPEEIYEEILFLRPDIIHVCGYRYQATEEFCRKARQLCPGIEIMQAVGVGNDPAVIAEARRFSYCDWLILDSRISGIDGIGAAGITHDWAISREIVKSVPCKVILAGGLGPDNVEEAIRTVHPYGVDSLTRTSKPGKWGKDMALVREFIRRARECELHE